MKEKKEYSQNSFGPENLLLLTKEKKQATAYFQVTNYSKLDSVIKILKVCKLD